MLQKFLESLNYIADLYKDLARDCAILYDRLKKKLLEWTPVHTQPVKRLQLKAKGLPYLNIFYPQG